MGCMGKCHMNVGCDFENFYENGDAELQTRIKGFGGVDLLVMLCRQNVDRFFNINFNTNGFVTYFMARQLNLAKRCDFTDLG